MRKTQPLEPKDVGRIGQYNRLRDEASASSYLLPFQQESPDLTLKVSPGNIYFGSQLLEFAGGDSPSFTVPTSDDRIDAVVLLKDFDASIIQDVADINSNRITDSTNGFGQSFTVTEEGFIVKNFSLYLRRGAEERTTNLSIQIFGADINGLPTGSPLFTEVIDPVFALNTSYQRVNFDTNSLELTPGQYCITVTRDSVGGTATNLWVEAQAVSVDNYVGGNRLSRSSSVWNNVSTNELRFVIEAQKLSERLFIIEGIEDINPIPPSLPSNVIPICYVYNRFGQTSILEEDDISNGYILKDLRPFIVKDESTNIRLIPSSTVRITNSDPSSTNSVAYIKVKEISVDNFFNEPQTVRISFGLNRSGGSSSNTVSAQVYRNGISYGQLRFTTDGTVQTYTEDLEFTEGDLIQIYASSPSAGSTNAVVRDMQILFDHQIVNNNYKAIINDVTVDGDTFTNTLVSL